MSDKQTDWAEVLAGPLVEKLFGRLGTERELKIVLAHLRESGVVELLNAYENMRNHVFHGTMHHGLYPGCPECELIKAVDAAKAKLLGKEAKHELEHYESYECKHCKLATGYWPSNPICPRAAPAVPESAPPAAVRCICTTDIVDEFCPMSDAWHRAKRAARPAESAKGDYVDEQ